MKEIDAVFDPASTWKPIEEGTYPAHIKSLNTKEVMTKKAGPAIVVNMTYVVADEAADYCLLYTSPSPRDRQKSRMPSSA